jgi:putative hydrolase of the HAD superfamily
MMRYPVVLLDVGETLIGPSMRFGKIYARVFGELGIDLPADVFETAVYAALDRISREIPPGRDRYAYYPGGEEEYWLRFCTLAVELATERPIERGLVEQALKKFWSIFSSAEAWTVFPDVLPALQSLKRAGVRLGVVSNWDSRLPRVLELLELEDYFDAVGVSHLEGVEKPAPQLFHRVLERLGARPEEALHIGDLPEMDLAGAEAAGIDCLLVDRRGRLDGMPRTIRDLTPLPDLALG